MPVSSPCRIGFIPLSSYSRVAATHYMRSLIQVYITSIIERSGVVGQFARPPSALEVNDVR